MKIPTTSELFNKHFGDTYGSIGFFHRNTESFFEELNKACLQEDEQKIKNTPIELD